MKTRIILITSLCFMSIISMTAQNLQDTVKFTIPELEQKINETKETLASINILQTNKKIASLESQIGNYVALTDLLKDSLNTDNSELERLSLIMTENVSIFDTENPLDATEYPLALSKHIELINHYIEARKICEKINKKIDEINSTELPEPDKKATIQTYISDDFTALDEKLTLIDNLDKSTLSESQKAYIKTLDEKYNSYRTYINYETD